jgi:hypothetical protein
LQTSFKEGIGGEKRPKDRVKREDYVKENSNVASFFKHFVFCDLAQAPRRVSY